MNVRSRKTKIHILNPTPNPNPAALITSFNILNKTTNYMVRKTAAKNLKKKTKALIEDTVNMKMNDGYSFVVN